jgi:hypothetical protein
LLKKINFFCEILSETVEKLEIYILKDVKDEEEIGDIQDQLFGLLF